MKNRRRGLTLVELIVTSGIGSILLGIALPALQYGDEEANRLACLDNLRLIALASHEYDDLIGELPPFMGVPGQPDSCNDVFVEALNYQLTYSLVQLLDFIGQSELVDATDPFAFSSKNAIIQQFGYPEFQDWVNGIDEELPGVSNIMFDIHLDEYRCPSDPQAPTDTCYLGPHPTNEGCLGLYFFPPSSDSYFTPSYSITNYVSNAGAIAVTITPDASLINSGFVGFHGPIRSRESDSVADIPDGASNVVLFGESLGRIDHTTFVDRRYSMALGGIAIGRADVYGLDEFFGTASDATWIQFGSAHPDVVNIVRADGSAQSINRTVNPSLFGRLCGAADGLPLVRGFGL